MHVAIITAGGAGMFCGSCMHDNTWARALMAAGVDVSLIPTYTPIRVDEVNVSESHVYFGGLNVYLGSRFSWWSKLPRRLTHWLDHPRIIRWATRFSIDNDASKLGELTLQMLAGEQGPHRLAAQELADHITGELKPDVVIFSNALLAGALPTLKNSFAGPIFCTLQGDDVFLEALPKTVRSQAIEEIQRLSAGFDGFFVHSRFYREFIADYLSLPLDRFFQLPLGIDLAGHTGEPGDRSSGPFTIGYFARIAPEKGLHHLVNGFRILFAEYPEAKLRVGGYLGPQQKTYFDDLVRSLGQAAGAFEYVGSPESHDEKVAFFRSLDILSVPTDYQEPKGLYVLEALANGVPVVQPKHGAFPELLERTGGGVLVPPREPEALAQALLSMATNREERVAMGRQGQAAVRKYYSAEALAHETLRILNSFLETTRGPSGAAQQNS